MFKKKNLIDNLTDYIKRNLKKGYTKDSLKWALLNQGYSRIEVLKALQRADIELAETAPVLKTKPEIKYEIVEENPKPKKKKGLRRFFGK